MTLWSKFSSICLLPFRETLQSLLKFYEMSASFRAKNCFSFLKLGGKGLIQGEKKPNAFLNSQIGR